MKRGETWNARVMKIWEQEGGKRTESTPVLEMGASRWDYPIKGLAWVRSWMLWRCKFTFRSSKPHANADIFFTVAIISQGIAARSALGQASSAAATVDSIYFDMFGRLAGRCAELDDETQKEEVKAKL